MADVVGRDYSVRNCGWRRYFEAGVDHLHLLSENVLETVLQFLFVLLSSFHQVANDPQIL